MILLIIGLLVLWQLNSNLFIEVVFLLLLKLLPKSLCIPGYMGLKGVASLYG
jgi:hypothetical protein